jgi:FdhD protein
METYIKKRITKIKNNIKQEIEDYIALEKKVKIFINKTEIISLYCTPSMIKELTIGLLLTEGIIKDTACNFEITISNDDIFVYLNSKDFEPVDLHHIRHLCGFTISKEKAFNKIKDDFSIPFLKLKELFEEFQNRCELFRLTGCFHSSAIADKSRVVEFAEDIGRHNSVDKVIGSCLLKNVSLNDKMIFVSCRLSSEILFKCATWSIPLIASISAPTASAVDIAEKTGITLIGFFRNDKANIYTNNHRVI